MLTISFRSSLHSPPLPGIIVYLYGKNTAAPLRREKSALMTAKTKENLSVAARVCVALMILLLIILNYDRLTHIDMRAWWIWHRILRRPCSCFWASISSNPFYSSSPLP